MFIHEALVGVKWKCTRGCRSSQRLISGVEYVVELSGTTCDGADMSSRPEKLQVLRLHVRGAKRLTSVSQL